MVVLKSLVGGVSLAALIAGGALAQDDVVVVNATPLGLTSDEVVGSVTVIGEDELVSAFNGNIADTLQSEPGISSSYFGPAAGRVIVRGLDAERVRMLVNGMGGLDAASSSPDHAVTSEVFGAEQIEVLRGAAAIAYGGGAVGGVVNVLDGRIPTTPVDGDFDGFVYAGGTSVDEGTQFAGRVGTNLGGLVLQADYMLRDADGYDIPGYAETLAEREEEEHEHEDEDHEDEDHEDEEHEEEEAFGSVDDAYYTFEVYSLGASWISDRGFIGIGLKETDADYGLPGHHHHHEEEEEDEDHEDEDEDHEHEEEEAPYIELEQTRIDIRGEFQLDGHFDRVRFGLASSDYQHIEFEEGEVGTTYKNDGLEGRVELSHTDNETRRGAWGFNFLDQDFSALGEEAFVEPVTTTEWGVFVTERWDLGDWGAEIGGRYESRELEGTSATRDYDGISASASVFKRPSDNLFLSATLARTERAPTDVEVFANGPHLATSAFEIGDLNLDTEKALSAEFSVRHRSEGLRTEFNIYYASYDGFIGLFATGEEEDELDVFEYRQSDGDIYGFEFASDMDLGSAGGFDFTSGFSVDYVRGELDGGEDLPRIAPLSANLSLEAARDNLVARVEADLGKAKQRRLNAKPTVMRSCMPIWNTHRLMMST
jgi:iron complex outermembrane receptor protein